MDRYLVTGGRPLHGRVAINGAKNSALKLMAAALLAEGTTTLRSVPRIADVSTMGRVLERLGCAVAFTDGAMEIDVPSNIASEAPYDLVRQMRASIIVLGPLLARTGRARVAMPGGCNIGSRKIDLHLKGLERMGVEVSYDHGYLNARSPGLEGATITLDFPSVGATENLLMAAVLAKGTTVIDNAAREPEIADLAEMLQAMGAHISGAGTPTIEIEGVAGLKPAHHDVVPDRIEAATYLIAGAATCGDVTASGARADHLDLVLAKLADAGCDVDAGSGFVRVALSGRPRAVDFVTLPYPGFPTDLQPQMMVLLSLADGTSIATENVFESRFMFVDELLRMGADIRTEGHHAVIRGRPGLQAAPVRSPDIRAGAALVIAGLVADGVTEIGGVEYIDRGYEDFEGKLSVLGAEIERRDRRAPAGLEA
ncbi:MAG: UDP-N-acetylglucosamine 1-carboxyvinyltransferase [Actinomycetota bacterium]|nr:UDP-N-acetylglucosamine 1-carboxyvinyltransferase [Actinomycetota bacterium]